MAPESTKSIFHQSASLVACIVICYSAAFIGAMASVEASSFYQQLIQPSWAPPASVFGPVWSVLFALMAFSVWLVYRQSTSTARQIGLTVFAGQLCLNMFWSWLFFGWKIGSFAFVEVILLWFTIALTMVVFWRVSKVAAVALVPYLAWVTFAAWLNHTLWKLNPHMLS